MHNLLTSFSEIKHKEQFQSHSFVFFDQGPPYCQLGWRDYRKFNLLIKEAVGELKKLYQNEIYIQECEAIEYERLFFWVFSFLDADPEKIKVLSESLVCKIDAVLKSFKKTKKCTVINGHDKDFALPYPELYAHYISLIDSTEVDFQYIRPPEEKSYQKESLDLKRLSKSITIKEFKDILRDHKPLAGAHSDPARLQEDLDYISAPDGFYSTKYRPNKYIREEFIPIECFVSARKIPDSAIITLGIEQENFDAKINNEETGVELILEITMGLPENNHRISSMITQKGLSPHLPLKNAAHLKEAQDSLPEKIIEAIKKKYDKNYPDRRILIVAIQSEYTYQHEKYLIEEILKEVNASISYKKNPFQEILLLCGSKFFTVNPIFIATFSELFLTKNTTCRFIGPMGYNLNLS